MSTELSNGVIIPEEYSDDWYDEMSINLRKLNDVITAASDNATDIQRLDTDKANQSDLTALTSRVSQNETDIIALQTTVSGALKREIVQSLPTEDISTTTIYMIRNSQSSGTNIYDEYMYINSQWELIGTSATDFSNYYTKNETDNLLSGKVDNSTLGSYYTKTESDNLLLAKANQSDLTALSGRVTQTETDITALQTAVSGALKREIVQTLPTQDISTTTIYMIRNTTTSGDNIYDEYMYINNLWELIGTSATDFSNYYTKTEIDTLLSGKQSSLSQTQLDAVNSGIDSSKVQQIATNTSDISSLQSGKANDNSVVHTSGNETISGNKNFQGLLTTIPSSSLWPDVSNTSDDITYLGSNAIHVEYKSSGKLTDLSGGAWGVAELGAGCFFFRINNGTDVRFKNLATGDVNRIPLVSGANRFINDVTPNQDNTYNLGSSSLRWRSINGINPGALGMPDLNHGIDISSYITVVANANKESLYTPPANGWVSVALTRSGGANMAVMLKQGNFVSSGHNIALENRTTTCNAMLPVKGGVQVSINSALADGIAFAYFYPCQGNV